ncbi:gamma-glutamyltransferase family protein [Dendrosporobacter sp. 1207_IL3150]|uniref:gamma-glutamyltransferase family protein n=1 Tax=Dendrosporobacter sp. 1207_IL3150 TaxID=3084054 RepID=UPI002FDAC364
MDYDSLKYPYPSQRNVIYAENGMVATSQPLAAQAGLDILKSGGNAIDAAVAMAACLTVVEPTSNGIGGDAFALVWTNGKLHGLNASGYAPKNLLVEAITAKGFLEIPQFGWFPVTVPGGPAAWAELASRFGKLPLKDSMRPAIEYAFNGYPVSPTTAKCWKDAVINYKCSLTDPIFEPWFNTFCIAGEAPKPGQIWRSVDMAKSLQIIAETNAEGLYIGELAERIDQFSRQTGGYLRGDDLAAYKPEWVEPISVNYRGYDIWEIPPNGHGLVALLALNILEGFKFENRDCPETYHKQIEAMKLAFADGQKYITDSSKMTIKLEDILSKAYAYERSALIGKEANIPQPGKPESGGTVYLAAADNYGNMVSYIQSNYMGFGSGIVVPGTGISLHNRGKNFSLDMQHVNCLESGKKPYHTIIPGFITKNNKAIGPFGVMGAFMQPQGHVQMVMNSIDFHLNPQAALDAPRWQWISGKTIEIEKGTSEKIIDGLRKAGHHVRIVSEPSGFGRGQIIWRDNYGIFSGGTEPRTDGTIACW